jgi:hypothetical protein
MVVHAVFRIDTILRGLLGNMMAAQFLVNSASCFLFEFQGTGSLPRNPIGELCQRICMSRHNYCGWGNRA